MDTAANTADKNISRLKWIFFSLYTACTGTVATFYFLAGNIRMTRFISGILLLLGFAIITGSYYALKKLCSIQKETEEALRKSENRFRTIVENVNDAIFTFDFDGTILDINENACRISGYSKEDLIGQNPSLINNPENEDEFACRKKKLLSEDRILFEDVLIRRDGVKIPVAVSAKIVSRDNNGIVQGFVRDITDRRKAEEQLKFQAKLLDSVQQSVIAADSKGKILYCNPFSENLYGWKKDELIGRYAAQTITPDIDKNLFREMEKITLAGNSWTGEIQVLRCDGSSFPAMVTNSPIFDEKGNLSGIIGISFDITEKKRLETELQHTQKMESIGTLAGGIAHDFNNILGPIMLHTEMAIDEMSEDNPLQTCMKEIYTATKRARDLVKQILTFARRGSEDRTVLKTSQVIKESIKFLRSTIPTTIEIHYENFASQDTVFADPTQINQIIMNLSANAAHAMRENGGLLEISMDNKDISPKRVYDSLSLEPGRYLKITVKDNGTGISTENLSRIFEPYFTTKKQGEGTGLGMAIIHGIVLNYRGDITIESTQGKGTTVNVYLPVIDAQSSEPVREKEKLPSGNERILFVDDEPSAIDAMKKMLEKNGYGVTARSNSNSALKTFRSNPGAFDLVITDMTMPNMTGKELTEKIKEHRPDIPVILCTGFSDQIDEYNADAIGIDAFMMKPVIMADMLKKIREVLDKNTSQYVQDKTFKKAGN